MSRSVRFACIVLAIVFRTITAIAQPSTSSPNISTLAELPDGFSQQILATNLTGATAMAVAPDGRIFICEQTGTLRLVKNDRLLEQPILTLPVDSSWERGLIGITLDPSFPDAPYIYVCYVSNQPYPHHVVSCWTIDGDTVVANSEKVLLEGDDQTKLGGGVPNGHQGGPIRFGKDGKLYIAIGEQTAGLPSQKLDTFQGKLLRINSDGSIPNDYPLLESTKGKYRAIWATGLRNPYGLAIDSDTGRILFNDVGDARWEEVNEAIAGANYGWPRTEGPSLDPQFKSPLYAYDRSQGKSITGGVFYRPSVVQFPSSYVGKYFFAEFMDHWIRVLDPDNPKEVQTFATGLSGPVDLQVGPDGSLNILNRNAWVRDHNFKPATGSLYRVRYSTAKQELGPVITLQPQEAVVAAGGRATFEIAAFGQAPRHYQWFRNAQAIPDAVQPSLTIKVTPDDDGAQFHCVVSNPLGVVKSHPADLWTSRNTELDSSLRLGQSVSELPTQLSRTGVFRSLANLEPAAGALPYDVNSPLWSDGADKRRWIILPYRSQIGFSAKGDWKFPAGTLFVKHFEMTAEGSKSPRRIETRLLTINRRGYGYGVTYRWREDGTDADLLTEGLTEEIDVGGKKHKWTYPSRNDCKVCHTANAGIVLGVNTRQLNGLSSDRDHSPAVNQLQLWNRMHRFDPPINEQEVAKLDHLVSVTDPTASPELRVRSYLDSNCAHCHRPGGTRAEFDARFDTPLDRQKLINGSLMSSDMGIAGAKLVKPGDRDHSMIYLRMNRRQDAFDMPPLASHRADPDAVASLIKWISSLAASH